MENLYLTIHLPEEAMGQRLDQALAALLPEHSRTRLKNWIEKGYVCVDNLACTPRQKVQGGEKVVIEAPLLPQKEWQRDAIPLTIVAEDEALIIINKPPGLVTHPGAGNPNGTLANALLHHDPSLAQIPRCGLVHRLDKNTSGLLVIARTLQAHTYLTEKMQQREIKREYEAVVNGVMISGGMVEAAIARHPTHRTRMAVDERGKIAVTHYRVLQRFRAHTHLKIHLETGRTHQIRIHMSHLHYPIVGDNTYGGRTYLPPQCKEPLKSQLQHFPRQALHAKKLALIHPLTNTLCEWECALPQDMQTLITALAHDKTLQEN